MHFPQGGDLGHQSYSGITPKWEQVKSVRTNGPHQDRGPKLVSGSLPLPVSGSNLQNVHFPHETLPASLAFLISQLGISKTDPGQGVGVI